MQLLLVAGALVALATLARPPEPTPLERRALELLRLAASVLGVRVPPLVVLADASGPRTDGRRILVGAKWIAWAAGRYCVGDACTDALMLGLFGHEMGHIIARDVGSPGHERIAREYRADWRAGYTLGLCGIAPDVLELVLADLTGCCSSSHGSGIVRAAQVRAGFSDGVLARMLAA